MARGRLCCPSSYHRALAETFLKGISPCRLLNHNLVFIGDCLNKDHHIQIWDIQLPLTEKQSWEPATPRLQDEAAGTTHRVKYSGLASLLFALIACFTEHYVLLKAT